MSAVRRLFLMMKTGMAAYFGITTGRRTPGLVNTIWSPSIRMQRKPSASKILTKVLWETGLNFGMFGLAPGAGMKTRLGENLLQHTHLRGRFEE